MVIDIGKEINLFNGYLEEIRRNIDIVDDKINKALIIFKISLDVLVEEECYEQITNKEIQNMRFRINRIERQFDNFRKYSHILFFILAIIICVQFIFIAIKL